MNAITMIEQHELAAPQTTQLAAGPMANAIAALQAGMTIEHLQGIMALQEKWEANEARKSYVADMAAFKLNPPEIVKNKLVGYVNKDGSTTGYFHATLGGVAGVVVDALAAHGFSHSWETRQADGLITVTCRITHRMGHSESTSMQAQPDQSGKKNAIQAVASSITYMQRYTLLAATGLATMDMPDDDGQASGEPLPDRPFVNEPRQPVGLPGYSDKDFNALFPAWRDAILENKKMPSEMVAFLAKRVTLTAEQEAQILNVKPN